MIILKTLNYNLILIICIFTFPTLCFAQNCDAKTLEEFFDCYGGQNEFSDHSINAITTFIQAEDAIHQGEYTQSKKLIDSLFDTYPKSNNVWWNVWNNVNGANVGSPHTYYGMRMMEDIINHHLNTDDTNIEVRKVNMKVILVGCSKGIQPTNLTELKKRYRSICDP